MNNRRKGNLWRQTVTDIATLLLVADTYYDKNDRCNELGERGTSTL